MSSFYQPKASFFRRYLSALLSMALTGIFLFGMFFVIFANNLKSTPDDVPNANAIVIFTGTAKARIETGLDLLAQGKGQRLLISGMYENQNFNTLSTLAPDKQHWVNCCVDLDYIADNTLTNAQQTALWAEVHGYQSLILVTSSHHVPRAFLELRRTMPTARLSSWSVVTDKVHLDDWWAYPGTTSLLMGEYMRYLWALAGLPRNY